MVNTLASQSHHIYQCQEKVFAQPDFLIWLLPLLSQTSQQVRRVFLMLVPHQEGQLSWPLP